MSWLLYLISLAFWGLIIGAFARLALPGKDPMSIPMTMLVGIAGSLIGGVILYLITGGRYFGGGWLASLACATGLVYLIRSLTAAAVSPTRGEIRDCGHEPLGVGLVVVVHEAGADRAVRGQPEVALELPGVVVAVPDGDLALGQHGRDLG